MAAPITILVNSQAGSQHPTLTAAELRQAAAEMGMDADVIGTETPAQMDEILKRLIAMGAETVAVSGGDGTVARAVQTLAHTNTALGIIPQGTDNNFAAALKLPTDVRMALQIVKTGVCQHVDLGKVRDTYFTEAAGLGLFANFLALCNDEDGGTKSYVRAAYAAAQVFFSLRARRLRLTMDGKPYCERALMCTAANSNRMAAGVSVAPGASLTDGALDVVILGDINRFELVQYITALRAHKQKTSPQISRVRAKEIRVASGRPMRVHCDGQIIGKTPLTISADPGALKVLIGQT